MAKLSIKSGFSSVANRFAYPLTLSHYVELINPLWSTRRLQARVEAVWDETKDTRTITLRPGANWRLHRAGQHVRIGVFLDGRQFTRTYTISSAPEQGNGSFTITVKAVPDGRASQYLVRQLKVGDYVPVGLPQGDFYLPDASPVQPLFITAGSGITPAMSMLRSMDHRRKWANTVHVHYAPHNFDVIFGKELRSFADSPAPYQLHEIHTHEYGEDKQTKGYFSEEQLSRLCPDWRDRDAFLCGPPGLIAAVEKLFEAEGLSRQLHLERFVADFAPADESTVGGAVRFAASGTTTETDGSTPLLRVAEDAGLNPQHGCRIGICHTCNTRLVNGCVRDLRTGELFNEPNTTVQICVTAAVGDCELDL